MKAPLQPLRNFVRNLRRRLARQPRPQPPARPRPNPPRVEFSYTIFWTKQVRQWPPERRQQARAALKDVIARPGFEANDYERRYHVPGLGQHGHAGASLLALDKVLAAFERNDEGDDE